MGFGFDLVLLDDAPCVTLYSFRKEGCEETELDKFWDKDDVQQAPDHDNLRLRLYSDVLDEHNFGHPQCFQGYDRWFRQEGDATDPDGINAEALCAEIPEEDLKDLSKPYPHLRLYCFRMRKVLVAGNGGVKREQRIGDNPELLAAWQDVRYVMKCVWERIQWTDRLAFEEYEFPDGYVEDQFYLEGDFHFEANDTP
jgi:hypothetical protein